MNIKQRLDKLETQPAFAPEPQEEMSEEEERRALCWAFAVRWLWFDDTGAVIVGELDDRHERYRPWLTEAAGNLNEWRCEEEDSLAPLLPMTPDDVAPAIDLLRRGHLHIADPSYCLERNSRIAALYKLDSREYLEAHDMARNLDAALKAYEASGGMIEPFSVESIISTMEDFLCTVE